MRTPNFFIVGKPKSGTTALHAMLEQHPDIYMSPRKEPHHFGSDHIESALRRRRGYRGMPYRDRAAYLGLFKGAGPQKIVGESTTNYLYSKVAAAEIARFDRQAKILIVLREPVDFLHSLHNQFLRSGQENVGDFRKALELEEVRKRGEHIPSATSYPEALFYMEQARYCEQVARFLDAFGRAQVKIILYEDFRKENVAVCQDVFRFLGVDSKFEPVVLEANPTKRVRLSRLSNWLIYHWDRKEGSIKDRAPRWFTGPIGRLGNRLVFTSAGLIPIDDSLREALKTRLRPDVEALGRLIGVDLAKKWGY